MSESTPLLRIRSLSKRYARLVALDSVDLDVGRGSIHALMGENGAGKSTLIKCLTGATRRDSGSIMLEGAAWDAASPRHAEDAGISTVFQEINLIPHMSIAENITLGRETRRFGLIDRRAARTRARQAIARLGLSIDVSREVGSCSIAVQQLVAIARALDVRAKLLVLDEPTSSLDRAETEQLFAILRQLRGEGLGVLFVTHFLDQVYAVTDRVTVLRDGRHVTTRATSEFPRIELVSSMLGRALGSQAGREEARAVWRERDGIAAEPSSREHAAVEAGALLSVKNLSRRGAIERADMTISQGTAVGLAGLLGSGRTELARLIFGVDQADGGSMVLDGERHAPRSPREAIARGVALTSESRKAEGIIPSLSVRENIVLALQARRGVLRSLPRKRRHAIADELITRLSIKAATGDVPISSLSGGNQQKALLARWLATGPRLLILDEPTRGIDVGAKQEIEGLIAMLVEQGMAVLFISSELAEVVRTCSRVVVLRDRRTVAVLEGSGLSEERVMEAIATHG